jgi:mannosyl-glycoprotein endo-beta-N-acetylglucosaminidase
LIVLSIGTLITEWESGSDICKTIFDNQGAVDVLVDKLSSITVHYNFDGWLINIENPIAPDKIANVIYFLRKLKLEMLQRGKATAQVIWYDSITKSGELKWQNELNEENRLVNTQLL